METESEVTLPETPDIDFSENFAEQETPDINFSDMNASETPDIDFGDQNFASEQETPDINFTEVGNAAETPDMDFNDHLEAVATEAGNQSRERADGFDDDDIDDLDEPDQYIEGEGIATTTDDTNEESNHNNNESANVNSSKPKTKDNLENRSAPQLPTARIKHIMKADPDVSLITGECTFLVTKATELFIESLAREAFLHTAQAKKKTVQKRDVDAAIQNVESLMFLEGMMNF